MERTLFLFLLEVTAKASVIVGVTAFVCWSLRRASAALRHFIWATALAGVLALPALAIVMPDWRVARLPAALDQAKLSRQPQTSAGESAHVVRASDPAVPSVEASPRRPRAAARRGAEATATPTGSEPAGLRTANPDRQPFADPRQPIARSADRRTLSFVLVTLWIAGALAAMARLLAGHARLWWMERHADRITDPGWLDLAQRVADQLRLAVPPGDGSAHTSAVRLLRCRRPTMPVCWGVRRPSLLLPSDADSWSVERKRIVLLHELAHAKRRDCLTQVLAQTAIAVHWFNPLVWLVVRRLRVERERACDDLVLTSGANAPDYADHLLDIARAFRTAGCPSWAAVAMARPSQLEGRLLAILDRHRDRRALTRTSCAVAAVLAVATVGTLATVQPAPAPAALNVSGSSQTASKNRPDATPVDVSRRTVEAVLSGEARPAPSPRAEVAPKVDRDDATELENLELKTEGVAAGEGVGFGVPRIDPTELARIATQAALALDGDAIAEQAEADRPGADPKIVAALVTALKDQSAEVRRQAASTLAGLRSPQALDALVAATSDPDKDVRSFAVQAISRHRSDGVTQALVRALKDNEPEVRRAAMHGVARLSDPKYIDVFVDASRSGDPEVRKLAVHTLSGFRDTRAGPPIVAALKDADADVRQVAIHGIARLRDPQYVDVLTAALKDADPRIREAAAHGLAQMRNARAVPGLVVALKDANTDVRRLAAHALGQIGDAGGVDPLIAALKDTEGEVREVVVHALGQFGRRAGTKERR
jgi:HEAT repeat protein/beta-lactamase regulating signal transducer with metallopeptidase domain